ncbi:hypothetical protein GCM10025867_33920 [Frondihabitans sucicola]|uniref:DUF8094 domain-containing protein n=1 Tax=Frondihabitans sucicola TaxID=1268041 RepID=A0ABM8GRP5_9MICO|nr:hypothetical protein [Frondihabitans sucicola]BDZ51151.1 hypothetical protein GCM10025867_33920 [Frondihabitans sucicola]
MRFVFAVVTLVVAALLVLLGLAQRTVFAPPDSVTSSISMKSDAPITVIPAKALKGIPGRESIHIAGGSKAFAAYARSTDIKGWVGDASYNQVSFDKATQKLVTKTVPGSSTTPDPADSDLWYEQYTGPELNFSLDAPDDISLIVASDGSDPAPKTVSVTWPLSTATPLVGPLLSAGLLVFIIGILLFVWAIRHHRRTRGPRRNSGGGRTRLPRSERRGSVRSTRRAALGSGAGRGSRGRRMVAVVPVVLVASLGLAGCSSDYWPQIQSGDSTAAPTPTASSTAVPQASDLQPPAVTVSQATRIIQRITAVQTQADKNLDATLAGTRFTGPALAQRTANYTIRKADKTAAAPVTIPSGKITLTLPQQVDSWPRTVFAVVQDATADTKVSPVGVMLLQQTARDPYKVDYLVGLEAGAQIPRVAPASIGSARLAPDVKLLTMEPDKLAGAYADILKNSDASSDAKYFQKDGDTLRDKIGKPYKDAKSAKLPATASIAYSSETATDPSVAFATINAGAIVSVSLNEIETVKPTKPGAEVNTEGEVKSLSGVSKSTKGLVATYGVQLLFSVPPVGSSDKIVLLGFSQGLISAKEVS